MIAIQGRGETFAVNDRNEISRPKIGMGPSGDWLLLGAIEYRCVFGRYVGTRRYSVNEIRAGKVPWKFKNGKQRCFVLDLDHGTMRQWGEDVSVRVVSS